MQAAGPINAENRVGELDVIRGFALFGVLFANIFSMPGFLYPGQKMARLVPAPIDNAIAFLSQWLVEGKAQALFSMLFGFGFALFLARADRAERDGGRLYLRRVGFLLVLGIAHEALLWSGDILNAYAMMGFLLILTRRWPGWLLLVIGLPLALMSTVINDVTWEYIIATPNTPSPFIVMISKGAVRNLPIIMGHDYLAFVRMNFLGLWTGFYLTGVGLAYLAWILGRFLIGSWLYRQGWLQNAAEFSKSFRRWAAILLPIGLATAALGPVLEALSIHPHNPWATALLELLKRSSQVVLGLGYAAVLTSLYQRIDWRVRLSGLGAVGRMALTNYLVQSVVYLFLFYGFGAGLLLYTSPSVSLLAAIALFAAQITFSRWWLERHQFGPAEWLWRSWVYRERS